MITALFTRTNTLELILLNWFDYIDLPWRKPLFSGSVVFTISFQFQAGSIGTKLNMVFHTTLPLSLSKNYSNKAVWNHAGNTLIIFEFASPKQSTVFF